MSLLRNTAAERRAKRIASINFWAATAALYAVVIPLFILIAVVLEAL